MRRRLSPRWAAIVIVALAGLACLSLAALLGFSYRAVREWQRSEATLAERRASETADRLVTALVRDMRGAQNTIAAAGWEDLPLEPPSDARALVGSAFARYPYPESFFAWRPAAGAPMMFFNRSDRPPRWMPAGAATDLFPVSLALAPAAARDILERVAPDVRQGRRFSTFEMTLGGARYQVVAGMFYRDEYHEELARVVGFTVNMAWARQHYFPDMARQVARIGDGLVPAIVDEADIPVVGPARARGKQESPSVRRPFPVTFYDPLLVGVETARDHTPTWEVRVRIADDAGLATRGAQRTLAVAAMGVAVLVVGLLLTARAARASAALAAMRSEFVSTVTHELKTPIATIRAIGDTIVRGRVSEPVALREYAQLVVQESRRLGRLVENLLAYARITDVTELYTFEPLTPRELVDDALREFRVQLSEARFAVRITAASDVPPVRGDRTGLGLALDNVLDNAIRYSDGVRELDVRVYAPREGAVAIEVQDHGVGIAEIDLPHVTRRFQRGGRPRASGSGLGLAIVERIVRDHQGTLQIESREGEGTTVRMTLPAAE